MPSSGSLLLIITLAALYKEILFGSSLLLLAGLIATGTGDDIQTILGPRLSPSARIVFPEDADWMNLTSRWDPFAVPDLRVNVEASTAADVQVTVNYAAKRGIKLLVKNTSHGFAKSVRSVVNGIQISVRQMNSISLDLENNVATLGGGVIVAEFIDALWKAGKRTATGNCDCVGLMGAGLGGGHGRHQGLYGLVSDNILSASLVTASGALITASSTQHPELYWALRGAGHNFGVVVEVKLKIYDQQEADMWTNAEYIYADKDLEKVFAFVEKYRDVQPKEMTLFVSFVKNIDDPTGPGRVRISMQYGGHMDFEAVGAPFLELGPVTTSNSSIVYPQVATAMGIGLNVGLCLHGNTRRAHFSTLVKNFKIPAIRDAKTFYDETMQKYPQFNGSSMVWEMYPLQAFKAVSPESTAYPHRDFNMISLFMVNYKNAEDDELAGVVGEKGRQVLLQSALVDGYQVYVNYALGDEANEIVYGDEPWRQEKLHALKKRYDPKGVFNAYNPIV